MEQKSAKGKAEKVRWEVCITDYELSLSYWQVQLDKWSYLVIGEEICPDTGRKHWQMFGKCRNPRTWTGLQKVLKPRHFEIARGDAKQASDYCKKDGKILLEHGELPKQGERTDLEQIKEEVVKNGRRAADLVHNGMIQNFQQLKFAEGLEKYQKPASNIREPPYVEWIWGETGTGKSYDVMTKEPDIFRIEPDCEWFDGYWGQEAVLFDDYRGNIPLNKLLQMLDRYQLKLKVKGGFTNWNPKRIYITSCKPPEAIYKNCNENIAQLMRRITVVTEKKKTEHGTEVGGNTRNPNL